jgi:hypothetical protein
MRAGRIQPDNAASEQRRRQFAEAFKDSVIKKDSEFGPYIIDIYEPTL